MGHAIGTSGLVGIATVLLVVMAILIIVALDRLNNISGATTNSDLQAAHDKLVWAQVFAWIAAGVALLLVLGYIALSYIEFTEWIHLILWILLFAGLIVSLILLAFALGDIDSANPPDDNDSKGYIWGALIVGAVALLVLLISGGWRIAHKTGETEDDGSYYVPLTGMTNGAPTDPAELPPQMSQLQVTTQPGTAAVNF